MDTPAATLSEPTTATPALADAVAKVLKDAAGPLAFKQVKAALTKAKSLVTKGKAKTTDDDIGAAIKEASGLGRCYTCNSGKGGGVRYWGKDETHALRNAAVASATLPQTMAKLVAALKAESKGVDPKFAEGVVRDLIGDGKLHEHPSETAKAGPLFGTTAPPPPPPPPAWYETKLYKKPFEALVKAAANVLSKGDKPLADILAALRSQLDPDSEPEAEDQPTGQSSEPLTAERVAELERLIVSTVSAHKPVAIMSIADLRTGLPTDLRGPAFDAAVLRLARSHAVRIQKDSVPKERTADQQALFVKSEQGTLFTSISV